MFFQQLFMKASRVIGVKNKQHVFRTIFFYFQVYENFKNLEIEIALTKSNIYEQ